MAVTWTPAIAVGVKNIDDQHKVLIKHINDLFEACAQGKGRSEVANLLVFLQDYTKFHFGDEEKYMISINYPGYAKQKALHTAFISEINKLQDDLDKTGSSVAIVSNANMMVTKWIVNHIQTEDKKIGDYAKTL